MTSIVSLTDLRRACRAVLRQTLTPMRYTDLTRHALALLEITTPLNGAQLRSIREDVREKILLQGAGFGYTGAPLCLGYLEEWFPPQRLLFNAEEPIHVPASIQQYIRSAAESVLRFPYVKNKGGTLETRAQRLAGGLLLQTAVSDYFRRRFPTLWRAASNARQYQRYAADDFRLWLPVHRQLVLVDVAGPHRDGLFGTTMAGKPTADLHILACAEEYTIAIQGFVSGREFSAGRFPPQCSLPISWLLVFLNCEAQGINYHALRQAANRQGAGELFAPQVMR